MERKQAQPKKAYQAPRLTALGTIEQITQGGQTIGPEVLGSSGNP